MRALLLRHASAGDPSSWEGDDRLRPLDDEGRRQAEALVGALAELGTHALYSSPALRCVQTLEPAPARLDLAIETRHELAVDARRDDALALLGGVTAALPTLCTHRELIEQLIAGRECEKGGIWVVDVDGDEVRPERYLPPPA